MGLFSKRRKKSSFKSSLPFLRWFGPGATSAGVLYAIYLLLTGGLSFSSLDDFLSEDADTSFRGETVSLEQLEASPEDKILLATFNIENFGTKKSDTRLNEHGVDVMGTLAQIISRFDLVAVQEIRGKDGAALQKLIDLLNQSGGAFSAVISEPIGNEARQECYAFVYNRTRIRFVPGSAYVVLDSGDRMYREPMVASFQTVLPAGSDQIPFQFTAINVHTDPDKVDPDDQDSEINILASVFHRVRDFEFKLRMEEDFILMGDLNVDPDHLGQLSQINGMISLAGDIKTNVSRSKTNDHILIDRNVTAEYAGRTGVVSFTEDLSLSPEQADSISDHLPLFAEFSRFESPAATASVSAGVASSRTRELR
ncbi:endonuclease/exonuclease/phosphatase family protein [Stieleria sp. JC731]|uniref:endonuclease/exonuclease/phosphatase family protein n=1 Tax=Pirellulaceae TaxID=2691357 RepID=UPI001E335604|nr:endonuclease/exonuclease/phosphatase family protein [Stieleria sp. JC731]MCC9600221.1 endonuclease/exonuclease/phosphatase family protein [Stieleria sp. JC731]